MIWLEAYNGALVNLATVGRIEVIDRSFAEDYSQSQSPWIVQAEGHPITVLFKGEEGECRRVLEGVKAELRLNTKLISISAVAAAAEKLARRDG